MKNNGFSTIYHLMLLPGIILLLIFSIYPMHGILMAFQDFNPAKGVWESELIGLDNFKYMFTLPDAKDVFVNTITISAMKLTANLLFALVFALMLNEIRQRFVKKSIQTVVYLPHFLSWVLVAGIFKDMFSLDGFINQIVSFLGFQEIMFFSSNTWFPAILVGSEVWKEFGFGAIVFLAALTGISPSLYEAAAIDGASRTRQLWHITLPSIASVIVLLAVLSLRSVLDAGFDQVFNMYNKLVYPSGDIIDTYVYRIGLVKLQFELATAVGLLKSVVSFILIIISYQLAYRFANYRIF
ncbi:protein lplB [Paenibacillus swuensis]|uniref:Protein lplB n=1 Tax=Paenibacillus swuensis TaxID=1178515 RepID=A0A172THQ4_9BACL|nr:ABC transporter permease subunit [Paenibacillus swuensis]ANE46589.1 protein lplB [Paenibacillus swuensis]